MLQYGNRFLNKLDESIESSWETLCEERIVEAGWNDNHYQMTNTNAHHSDWNSREYTNPDRFMTDLRRERLISKIKSFPAELFIQFHNPKTLDRVQILVTYTSLDEEAEIDLTTWLFVELKDRYARSGWKKAPGDFPYVASHKEKRVKTRATIEKTVEVVKNLVKKLKASGFVVETDDTDWQTIYRNYLAKDN